MVGDAAESSTEVIATPRLLPEVGDKAKLVEVDSDKAGIDQQAKGSAAEVKDTAKPMEVDSEKIEIGQQKEPSVAEVKDAAKPVDVHLEMTDVDQQAKSSVSSGSSIASSTTEDLVEKSATIPGESTAAELARNVSEFVESLESWKANMPPRLLESMKDIQSFIKTIQIQEAPPLVALPPPSPPKAISKSYIVEKTSMHEWMKRGPIGLPSEPPPAGSAPLPAGVAPPPPPPPTTRSEDIIIIEAFYRNLDNTQTSELNGESSSVLEPKSKSSKRDLNRLNDTKNLQRLVLYSNILREELSTITGSLITTNFVVIAPPYKLLVPFIDDIKVRVTELEEELSEIKPKNGKSEGKSAATSETDDTAEKKTEAPQPPSEKDEPSETKDDPEKVKKESDLEEVTSTRLSQLKSLYDLIRVDLKDVFELRAKISDGLLKTIAFEDLWHLFKPGDIIYSEDPEGEQLYRIFAVTGGQIRRRKRNQSEYIQPPAQTGRRVDQDIEDQGFSNSGSGLGTWTSLKIDCYMMQSNGSKYGPEYARKIISHYVGERDITKLPIYPVGFHPERDELLRRMEVRGKRYVSSSGYKSYVGKSIPVNGHREEIESDVYIDLEEYYNAFPVVRPNLSRLQRSPSEAREYEEDIPRWQLTMSGEETDVRLTEDFIASNRDNLLPLDAAEVKKHPEILCLFPPFIEGWVFRTRKWAYMDIDLLKDIDKDSHENSGFNDLVIQQTYRDMLVALVDNHASALQRKEKKLKKAATKTTQNQIDIVRGKGLGLIILLHGPPGSGKTSTAETIAAYTRRPLYSITCGDLGTTPEKVEEKLGVIAQRADKWGCVLLLDEADVFLMQRDRKDMDRNALVSVFLRHLEYYSGILFLTTNRVGVIDEAFKSRIHVSLRYPRINLTSTIQIWTNILDRLNLDNEHNDIKVDFKRATLLEFAETHYKRHEIDGSTWNGRQIRNAFQTALALAQYERIKKLRENGMTADEAAASGKKAYTTVRLTKKIFKDIAKTAREFAEYIDSVRKNDTDTVLEDEVRNDYFDPGHSGQSARKKYPPKIELSPARLQRAKAKQRVQEESNSESDDDDEAESEDFSDDD